MKARLSRVPINAHVVDISFSVEGDEKKGWKDPVRSRVNSRRNSHESSHSSQESMSYDSLLSFALKMNSSQVAASVMMEQDAVYDTLENSSFLTNVVNKESLKRGLSEQQIMIRVVEEVERARQRFIQRARTVQNLSDPLHPLVDAASLDMGNVKKQEVGYYSDQDEDEGDDCYSSDSIGSNVDDDAASGFGVGEGALEAEEAAEEGESGNCPQVGAAGAVVRDPSVDRDAVFHMFSSLLEDGEDVYSDDNSSFSDDDVKVVDAETVFARDNLEDRTGDHHHHRPLGHDGGGGRKSSSYFELSKSQQEISPRSADVHLHRLLADVYSRSPSRLPRAQSRATAEYSDHPSSILYTNADPYTAEYAAVPSSRCSSMDFSCLISNELDSSLVNSDELEDMLTCAGRENSRPTSSFSSLGEFEGSGDSRRTRSSRGDANRSDLDKGSRIRTDDSHGILDNREVLNGHAAPIVEYTMRCSKGMLPMDEVMDADYKEPEAERQGREQAVEPAHSHEIFHQERCGVSLVLKSSTSKRHLGILCEDGGSIGSSPSQDALETSSPSPVCVSRRNSDCDVSSSRHEDIQHIHKLSALNCMVRGGLNEWLVMNMRSQGVLYGTTKAKHDDSAKVDYSATTAAQSITASEAFNVYAERYLDEMAHAISLQRDIEIYKEQKKASLAAQHGQHQLQAGEEYGVDGSNRLHADPTASSNVECRSVAVCVASNILHRGSLSHISKQKQNVIGTPKDGGGVIDFRAGAKRELNGNTSGSAGSKGGCRRDPAKELVSKSMQFSDTDTKGSSRKESAFYSGHDLRQSWNGYELPDSKNCSSSSSRGSSLSEAKDERKRDRQNALEGRTSSRRQENTRWNQGEAEMSELVGDAILRKAISDSNISTMQTAMTLGDIAAQIVVEALPT